MKKLLMGLMFLLFVTAINVPSSNGFPWIFKQYRDLYMPGAPEGYADTLKDAGCYVCHDGTRKEQEGWQEHHNEYGEHLEDILGDPDALLDRFKDRSQRDQVLADVDAAIEQVDTMEAEDGRTYGDIIRSGELPVPLPEGFYDDEE